MRRDLGATFCLSEISLRHLRAWHAQLAPSAVVKRHDRLCSPSTGRQVYGKPAVELELRGRFTFSPHLGVFPDSIRSCSRLQAESWRLLRTAPAHSLPRPRSLPQSRGLLF